MVGDYDLQRAISDLRNTAEARLSGPVTVELVQWADGDFRAVAYHTIDATYPSHVEARGGEHGEPYYRERVAVSTADNGREWASHEVVRRRCGETGSTVLWSERVGDCPLNWVSVTGSGGGGGN